MKIHEYQARELFERYGIPVNEGRLVSSGPEARSASRAAGWKQTVVKAQVLAGGRGKAGGVKLARTPDEVEEKARGILGLEIKGYPVEKVLVCDAVEIAREIYLGMVLDRSKHGVTLMLTAEGGVEIEELAASNPDAIHKMTLYPHRSLDESALDRFIAKALPDDDQRSEDGRTRRDDRCTRRIGRHLSNALRLGGHHPTGSLGRTQLCRLAG